MEQTITHFNDILVIEVIAKIRNLFNVVQNESSLNISIN